MAKKTAPPVKVPVSGPYRILAVRCMVEVAEFKDKMVGRTVRTVDLLEIQIPDAMEAVLRKMIDSGKSGPVEPARG